MLHAVALDVLQLLLDFEGELGDERDLVLGALDVCLEHVRDVRQEGVDRGRASLLVVVRRHGLVDGAMPVVLLALVDLLRLLLLLLLQHGEGHELRHLVDGLLLLHFSGPLRRGSVDELEAGDGVVHLLVDDVLLAGVLRVGVENAGDVRGVRLVRSGDARCR